MSTGQPDLLPIECHISPALSAWLQQSQQTIAVSTYQAGKLLFLSWGGQQPSLLIRQFDKPMGMAFAGNRLALATRHEVLLFANAPLLAPTDPRGSI